MGAMLILLASLGLLIWALGRNHRRNAERLRLGIGGPEIFDGDHGGRWTHR